MAADTWPYRPPTHPGLVDWRREAEPNAAARADARQQAADAFWGTNRRADPAWLPGLWDAAVKADVATWVDFAEVVRCLRRLPEGPGPENLQDVSEVAWRRLHGAVGSGLSDPDGHAATLVGQLLRQLPTATVRAMMAMVDRSI